MASKADRAIKVKRKAKLSPEEAGFQRPPTAGAAVLAELRRWISDGRLSPGEQVVADVIGEQLGVSRVPVREALRILEGEGQVTYRPHQGYFVAELSLKDLVELYRIRALLEEEAIREAVPRMQVEDIDRMAEAVHDMEHARAAAEVAAHIAANRRYHFAIFEASDMPHLVRLIRVLWDSTDPYRSLYFNDPGNRKRSAKEHEEILAAVSAGDANRAVQLMNTHRAHSIEALERTLSRASSPS